MLTLEQQTQIKNAAQELEKLVPLLREHAFQPDVEAYLHSLCEKANAELACFGKNPLPQERKACMEVNHKMMGLQLLIACFNEWMATAAGTIDAPFIHVGNKEAH